MNEAPRTTQSPAEQPSSNAHALPNPGRRRLAGMGLGAPVVLTLASRPAFGGQCLSNMMSGNLSDPNRGNCSKGWSPGAWKNPGGQIGNYSTLAAWAKAGVSYGTKTTVGGKKVYTGGTQLSVSGIKPPSGAASNITMREVLLNYPGTIASHTLTAWLNAKLGEADPNYQYILTSAQVIALGSGGALPPGYPNLQTFLDSTWV